MKYRCQLYIFDYDPPYEETFDTLEEAITHCKEYINRYNLSNSQVEIIEFTNIHDGSICKEKENEVHL